MLGSRLPSINRFIGDGGSHIEPEPRVVLVVVHRQRDANGFEVRQLRNLKSHLRNLKSHRPVRLEPLLSKERTRMLNGRVIAHASGQHRISAVAQLESELRCSGQALSSFMTLWIMYWNRE